MAAARKSSVRMILMVRRFFIGMRLGGANVRRAETCFPVFLLSAKLTNLGGICNFSGLKNKSSGVAGALRSDWVSGRSKNLVIFLEFKLMITNWL